MKAKTAKATKTVKTEKTEKTNKFDNTMMILMPTSHIGKGVIADGPEVRTHALRVRNPHGEIMSEKHDKNKSFYVVLNGKKMRFYVVEVVGSAFYVELLNVATLKVEQN